MNVLNNHVTPSEMVLLNGAQFASAAGWLGSKVELFDGETKVSGPEFVCFAKFYGACGTVKCTVALIG